MLLCLNSGTSRCTGSTPVPMSVRSSVWLCFLNFWIVRPSQSLPLLVYMGDTYRVLRQK